MSIRSWLLVIAALVLIAATLLWWQHVADNCSGEVVRGMWNQPVCTGDDR